MFRGNYRRLICVRYEDLKICDRRYGSESFNIVPGTEYLLPQHLEDIARFLGLLLIRTRFFKFAQKHNFLIKIRNLLGLGFGRKKKKIKL